jgi:hypothetical protein
MSRKLITATLATALFCTPVLGAPVQQISSQAAQGYSGAGITAVLAPGHPVAINFGKLGEKIASVTPGDRSRFVFNVAGSVLILRSIKPLQLEGEYSTQGATTLLVTTAGAAGQSIYQINVKFSSRPTFSVVEITPDGAGFDNSIPTTVVKRPQRTPIALFKQTPQETLLPVPEPPKTKSPEVTVFLPPFVDPPREESKEEPKKEVMKESKDSVTSTPKSQTTRTAKTLKPGSKGIARVKLKEKPKQEPNAKVPSAPIYPRLEAKPEQIEDQNLTPSQRAYAETAIYRSKAPSSQEQAIALDMGLTASGTKLGSRDWQKAQVAMSLLKEGQSLESAADQARISVKKLKQYIALGIKKNA